MSASFNCSQNRYVLSLHKFFIASEISTVDTYIRIKQLQDKEAEEEELNIAKKNKWPVLKCRKQRCSTKSKLQKRTAILFNITFEPFKIFMIFFLKF